MVFSHLVGAGSKSSQAFIINVNSQRIDARDQHINSQVELVLIDEQRVADIAADDAPVQIFMQVTQL